MDKIFDSNKYSTSSDRDYFEDLERSFEWPVEEKPESSHQMKKREEGELKKKRKKRRLEKDVEQPGTIIEVNAYKGDLTQGLIHAYDIFLWRKLSADRIQLFERVHDSYQVLFESAGTTLRNKYSFCYSQEQNLKIKLKHVNGSIFKVLNVDDVENRCFEGDYASFGLKSMQELEADYDNSEDLTQNITHKITRNEEFDC